MKSFLYDLFATKYTKEWVRKSLLDIPKNSLILDVGIGNGSATLANIDVLVQNNIKIIGIDINENYINECKKKIKKMHMENYIEVFCENIYKWKTDLKFDFILFSDSYAVIPNVHFMIMHSSKFLNKNGRFIIVTALFNKRTDFKRFVKKNLKYLIGVDLGDMMLYSNLMEFIKQRSNFVTVELISQHYFLIIGKVKMYSIIWKPKKTGIGCYNIKDV